MGGRPLQLLRTPDETPEHLKQDGWTLLSNIDQNERLDIITQLRQTKAQISLLIQNEIIECEIHDGTGLDTRVRYTKAGAYGPSIVYLSELLGGGQTKVLAKNFSWHRSSVPKTRDEFVPTRPKTTLAHWVTIHEGVGKGFTALWDQLVQAGELGKSSFYLVERSALKETAPEDAATVVKRLAQASTTPLVRAELDPSRGENNQHRIITGPGPHHSSTTLDLLVRGQGTARVLVEMRHIPLPVDSRVELFPPSREHNISKPNGSLSDFSKPAPVKARPRPRVHARVPNSPTDPILKLLRGNMVAHSIGRRQFILRCNYPSAFMVMTDLQDELDAYGLREKNHIWEGNVTKIEQLYSAILRSFSGDIDQQLGGARQRQALQRWINVSGLTSPYIHIETDVHVTPPSFTASFYLGS